jgi:hypothetical protein
MLAGAGLILAGGGFAWKRFASRSRVLHGQSQVPDIPIRRHTPGEGSIPTVPAVSQTKAPQPVKPVHTDAAEIEPPKVETTQPDNVLEPTSVKPVANDTPAPPASVAIKRFNSSDELLTILKSGDDIKDIKPVAMLDPLDSVTGELRGGKPMASLKTESTTSKKALFWVVEVGDELVAIPNPTKKFGLHDVSAVENYLQHTFTNPAIKTVTDMANELTALPKVIKTGDLSYEILKHQ